MADFTGAQVNQWYQQYWKRSAAQWEQDYWLNQGLSGADVERTLRDAPEARQAAGGGSAPGGGAPGGVSSTQPPQGFPAWGTSPYGQSLFTQVKTAFPQMSDQEVWAQINYPQSPDARFMQAILTHLQQNWKPPATATTTPTTPTTPAPTTSGFTREVWDQLVTQYPGTVAGLAQLVREHPELGLKIVGGGQGDIQLPDGRTIDVLKAAGLGGQGWQWLEGDTGGGGGGQQLSPTSPLLAPFTTPFKPPDNLGGDLPAAPPFNYGNFVAPTADDVLKDPGYQFRKNEAEDAFLNSAAAQGVMRSGGTLQDFLKYGQQMASQEYSNVFDRASKAYETNFNTAKERYSPQLLDWQTRNSDVRDQQNKSYDRAWQQYLTDRDTYYKNQQNIYDRLYGTSNLGLGATAV